MKKEKKTKDWVSQLCLSTPGSWYFHLKLGGSVIPNDDKIQHIFMEINDKL